jgi:hypothetical protein
MQALGEEAFLDLNDEVFAAAIRRPLVGIFEEVPENGIAMQGTELISSVITLPLAPLRTFGKVNETADSIREFNRIAERFADIVEDTPREARWQLELFAHTLEEKDSVTSAVLALDRASLEVARLRELIEEAPELSRAVVRAAAEETTRALPAVRQTIDEARQLVRETDALTAGVSARLAEASVTLNDAERAAKSLDSLALTLQTTLDKTDALATRLGLGQPRTTDPSARPFDLRDLEAAARAIEAAVMQINDALDRSDAILGSNQLDARLDDGESRARRLAEETGVIVRHTVDQILWRLFVGTIALIIIALLGTAALMRLRRG